MTLEKETRTHAKIVTGLAVLSALTACQKSPPPLPHCGTGLNVRVIFGYKDARPARFVGDRYEAQLFIQAITEPCSIDRRDCGFTAQKAGPAIRGELFARTVIRPEGCVQDISLTVVHSSVSPDDVANRANPFQKWATLNAQLAFTEALKGADIVFYNGHSRSGGGPDFGPPRLEPTEHPDYPWYRKNQPGIRLIEQTFSQVPHTPVQELGLFSCASEQLFADRIHQTNKGVKLRLSNQLLYFSDAMSGSLDALSDVLGGRPD